jgi:uncharacterized protein YbjQ (UPF0145 family)
MMVVTTEHIPGQEVIRVLGRVLAVITRRRSPAMAGSKLRDLLTSWRSDAVSNMVEAAQGRGANAVLSVRFDHRDIGESWVEISVYGMAVVIRKESSNAAESLECQA